MMKRTKVARNKFSNFESSILIMFAMLHRMVLALFTRSSESKDSVVLVLVEDLRENSCSGFEIFSCSHRSSLTILIVIGDVDRREVVQVSAKTILSIRGLAEFHPLAT